MVNDGLKLRDAVKTDGEDGAGSDAWDWIEAQCQEW